MAPWRDSSTTSMRQASMAMSCVADEKPTSTARIAISPSSSAGLRPDTSHSPTMMGIWQASIQERRWPSRRVSHGTRVRSTSGAHRNLKE